MNLKKFSLIFVSLAVFTTFVFVAPARAETNAVLTVNVAGDYLPDGCNAQSCMLREAIMAANATPGVKETIKFNIPTNSPNCNSGTGVCTIKLIGALPDITDPVIIDGYTQPGAHPNTLTVGDDAALKIVVDGTGLAQTNGFLVKAGQSTIQGLVIQNFSTGIGIYMLSNSNLVSGNFIGTDATGETAKINSVGVLVQGSNNLVGGATPGARNVVSGNNIGVYLVVGAKNSVTGNYIGTDRQGLTPIPNITGVNLTVTSDNLIGGKGVSARNVIAGNSGDGVWLSGDTHDNVVQGNYIGVAANKSDALGNGGNGIRIEGYENPLAYARFNTITQNRISNNGYAGISVGFRAEDLSYGNTITRNAISSNGHLGIDIFPSNINNPNDNHDTDDGPNHLQNYPNLTKVTSANGTTTIKGNLKSAPKKSFRIEFFVNNPCQDSGHGEGTKYFGAMTVTTSNQGTASFTFIRHKTLANGTAITATATEIVNALPASTSEFSSCQGIQ